MAKVEKKKEPPKKKAKRWLWGIIAILVIVVLIVAAVMMNGTDDDGDDDEVREFKVGDYLRYQFSGSASGVMYMNCTYVNETSYVFAIKLFHDDYVETPPSVQFNRSYDVLYFSGNPIPNLGEKFVGTEVIDTALGRRSADHYLDTTNTSAVNVYIGSDTGVILILHQVAIDLTDITVELKETNVAWI